MIIEESFGGVVRGYIDPKTLSPSKEGLGIMCVLRNGYVLKEWLVVSHSDLQDRFIYLHNSPCCVDFDFLRLNFHPCLVRLIGYGSNRDYLFLVSEYFPNGSLERHIYRESRSKSLPWEIRLKVSIGAAQGLAFLHSRKSTGLYRGNLTASKILLDPLDAALSERSHIPTNKNKPARFHYAPPGYIFSGNNPLLLYPLERTVHMAGDVYSFGVILLEILTGLDNRRIILAMPYEMTRTTLQR
uniref:Protein kinase domain-containing protein n=1 Tax=Brassica oleracea TaxID=3712 RepID=A0A3P6E2Y8_BRAOL|nr:unnamed protein product [Brassica oleracea]